MDFEEQKTIQALLRDHSETFLKMAFSSDKRERLARADGHGTQSTECGDRVDIYIMVRDRVIERAAFDAAGCLNTFAVANTVAHLVEGRSIEHAWQLESGVIMDYLETLSQAHTHCAELAVSALRNALADHRQNSMDPWRTLYRRS